MRRDKTVYFLLLLISIFGLWMSVKADAAEVTVGAAPGVPYCAELNEVMSTDVQLYLYEKCQEFGIDYCFALGIIELESSFKERAYSSTKDRGLMQVNKQWVDDFQRLGWIEKAQDLYDPYTNIKCGIYILSYSVMKYGNTERAYAYYNTGDSSVKSNKASRAVMQNWEKWKERMGK